MSDLFKSYPILLNRFLVDRPGVILLLSMVYYSYCFDCHRTNLSNNGNVIKDIILTPPELVLHV